MRQNFSVAFSQRQRNSVSELGQSLCCTLHGCFKTKEQFEGLVQEGPNLIFFNFEKNTSSCVDFCLVSVQEGTNFYRKYSHCYRIIA